MIKNLRFIRVEVNDVVNVILDGIDVVMFLGEIVKGKYLLVVVEVMNKIVKKVDVIILLFYIEGVINKNDIIFVVVEGSVDISERLNVKFIVVGIEFGRVVRDMRRYFFRVYILVIINNEKIVN